MTDRCLTDRGRLRVLNATLASLTAGAIDVGVATGASALASLVPTRAAAGNLSQAAAGVLTAASAAAASLCGMRPRVAAGVTAAIGNGVSTAFSAGVGALTAALLQVPSAPGLASWHTRAAAVDPALVSTGVQAAGVLRNLVTTALPHAAATLTAPALRSATPSNAPGAILRHVADELDALVAVLSDQSLMAMPSVSLHDAVATPARILDDLAGGGGGVTAYGAAHLLATLAANDTVLPAPYEGAATLRYDGAGHTYPDGRLCLTDACLAATAAEVNTAPLADSRETGGALPIPLSREMLVLLTWLPLVALAGLGVWALTARRCCRDPRWQKAPAGCMVGIQVCCLPPLLLVSGLVLAVLIITTDVCTYGRGVAANWLVINGAALCTATLSGVGDGTSCLVNTTLPLSSADGAPLQLSLNLHLTAVVRGLLAGECGDASLERDPLLSPAAAGLDAAAALVAHDLPVWAADAASDAGMQLGPAGSALLANITARAAAVLRTAVLPVLRPALSCPAAARLVDDLEGVLCTSLFPPLAYLFLPWVGAAAAMLLLGLPAALLGRKRWVSVLWGPAYAAYLSGGAACSSGGAADGGTTTKVDVTVDSGYVGWPTNQPLSTHTPATHHTELTHNPIRAARL